MNKFTNYPEDTIFMLYRPTNRILDEKNIENNKQNKHNIKSDEYLKPKTNEVYKYDHNAKHRYEQSIITSTIMYNRHIYNHQNNITHDNNYSTILNMLNYSTSRNNNNNNNNKINKNINNINNNNY